MDVLINLLWSTYKGDNRSSICVKWRGHVKRKFFYFYLNDLRAPVWYKFQEETDGELEIVVDTPIWK